MFSNFLNKFRIYILFLLVLILVSAPVLANASSDTVLFDIWSGYSLSITFVDYDGVSHNNIVKDTNVTRYGNSVVIDNAQPLLDDLNYPFFRYVALDVPFSYRSPRFYISDLYLNRPFMMSVNLYISSDQPNHVSLYDVTLDRCRGYLFTDVSGSSYLSSFDSNPTLKIINDDSFEVSFNCTFTFTQPCYIYGFNFDVLGIFDFNIAGDPIDFYSFYSKFTLSDLFLSNDLTPDQIEDAVSDGILNGTGGDNYSPLDDSAVNNVQQQEDAIIENIEQYKEGSLNSSDFDLNSKLNGSDLIDLQSTMIGLSNLVTNKFINKLPFSTVIYFAIGLGAFGFLFGLTTWSIGTIAKQNSVKASRSRRNKGG